MGNVSHISKLPSTLLPDWGFMKCRGVRTPKWAGTVLLYLKCFLTSFCAPVRVPASSVWLGPVFLLSPAPLPIWCSSWPQVLPAILLSHWLVSVHLSCCSCLLSLPSFPVLGFFQVFLGLSFFSPSFFQEIQRRLFWWVPLLGLRWEENIIFCVWKAVSCLSIFL